MFKNLSSKILFVFTFFCIFLILIFLWKQNERNNAPKIILKSEKDPMEINLPEPTNSNMSIEQIEMELKNLKIKDNNLDIDDIK